MYSGMMANLDYYLSQKPIHPTKMLRSGPITGSFFDVIKGFIHSVNTMESTVLVPTLLKDINLDGVTWVPTLMAKGNYRQLFEIYCLIKKCKSHFTEVDFDDVDNSSFSSANKGSRLNQLKAKELAKTIDSSFLMFSIDSEVGFVDPDYCRPSSKVSDTTSSSPSSTPTLSSSSSVTTNTGSDRKQKISLDSGWSSRGSDSIDDDFDFDTSNGISGSSILNDVPINYLIDSDDINDSNNNTSNNMIHNHDHHHLPSPSPSPLPLHQHQQQPLTVPKLLRATSTNLRNLKALFNHLKEVADFVTQQYLQALQLI